MRRTFPPLVALVVLAAALSVPAAAAAPSGSPSANSLAATAQESVTLTVSVVNQDGDPVQGAELTATWSNGSTTETTASNGKAFVDVPKDADVTIAFDHSDYVRNHPVTVENATTQNVEVEVYRTGSLAVDVADADGALADARVTVDKNGRQVAAGKTGADGAFDTGAVEVGEYRVSVVKPGYYRQTTTVTVDGGTTAAVRLRRGSVTVAFAVSDDHFSPPRPVAGATVAVESVGSVTSLADGEAVMRVPVNSVLSVETTKDGYETVTTDLHVGESDLTANLTVNRAANLTVTPMNYRVVAGETVLVTVTDEYHDPVADATVLLDGETAATTDSEGEATVRVETGGEHVLSAETANATSADVTVRAVGGDNSTTTTTATTTTEPTTTTAAETTTARVTTTASSGLPGFTLGAALAALAIVAFLVVRR